MPGRSEALYTPSFDSLSYLNAMNKQAALVMTMTGEIFQPVRLYYKIRNMNMVLKKFAAMSCMNHDKANNRWTWLYDGDSMSLQFKNSYCSLRSRQTRFMPSKRQQFRDRWP
jgi:hypothetical protein